MDRLHFDVGTPMSSVPYFDGIPGKYLRNHDLSGYSLGPTAKTYLARQVIEGHSTASELSARLNINRKSINGWVHKVRAGKALHPDCGRPPVLDDASLRDVIEATTVRKGQRMAKSLREFTAVVNDQARATAERRGIGNNRPPSKRTVKTIFRSISGKATKCAGTTTAARIREESDPRNMFVEAVMLEAFQRGLPHSHVINLDASTYNCGLGSKNHDTVYIRGEDFEGPIIRVKSDGDFIGCFLNLIFRSQCPDSWVLSCFYYPTAPYQPMHF